MNRKICSAAFVSLALIMTGSDAHALGNACRRVNFSVDNNHGGEIIVEKFELYSVSQGRWMNEDFTDSFVPTGAQDFPVQRGETMESSQNDIINQIRVSFRHFADNDPDEAGEWHDHTRIDHDISDPICVSDRWYKATIGP